MSEGDFGECFKQESHKFVPSMTGEFGCGGLIHKSRGFICGPSSSRLG